MSRCCERSPNLGLTLDGGSSSGYYPTSSQSRCQSTGLHGGTGRSAGSRCLAPRYSQQVVACGYLLVERVGDDIARWKTLIEKFESLTNPVQKEFLERLNGLAESALDEESRRLVAEALRQVVSRHRKFADAKWALPDAILLELDTARRRFEPADPVQRNAWLFGPRWQVVETLEGQEERLEPLRRSGLQEVINDSGWKGIERLVEAVESPEEIGAAFAEFGSDENEARILPGLLVSGGTKAARFAGGYTWARFRKEGWDWISRLKTQDWSANEVAQVLVVLPFERRTWEFAASKGNEVATGYWSHTPPLRFAIGDNAR